MASIVLLLGIAWMPLSAQAPDWQAAANGQPPGVSTPVGYSADGNPLFLLRSERSGITNLGWYDSGTGAATMIGADRSAPARGFEVYSGAGRWAASRAGSLPANFISAGNDANGQPLYILRVSSGGWLVPAIYSVADNAAVTFIGGKRLLFSTFEALVPDWARAGDSFSQAFRGGTDSDGSILAPFRAQQGGGLQPGKFNTGTRQGYISYGGKELAVRDPSAEVFIGTGVWTPANGSLPRGAIPAGYDTDGSTLYMIRAAQAGAQALGKYSAQRGEAYIPYGGNELKVTSFEILCYDLRANRENSILLVAAAVAVSRRASPAEEAVKRSGLKPVLTVDFDRDASDLSASRADVGTDDVAFGSSRGVTYGAFNGRSSVAQVDFPGDIRLDRATVMVRVNSAFSKTWQAILNSTGWSETSLHFQFRDRTLEVSLNGNDPTNADVDYPFDPGQWYEIVFTYDMRARMLVVYVNGARAATIRYNAAVPYVLNQLDIGAWDGEDRYFDGQIDYVYVLNGVMSERDVMSSFSTGPATPSTTAVRNPPPPPPPPPPPVQPAVTPVPQSSSPAERAIARSGLVPVLKIDFDNEVRDLSATKAIVQTNGLQFGSSDASTYAAFNGRNSYAQAVFYPGKVVRLDQATVMTRVKSTTFSLPWQAIVDNSTWTESSLHFQFLKGNLEVAIAGNSPNNLDVVYDFQPGQWYDIVLTYDMRARMMVVYINGAKAASMRYTASVPYELNQIDIGSEAGIHRFFDGQIDYVYILNGAMSEQDVLSSFSTNNPPPPVRPVAASPAPVQIPPSITGHVFLRDQELGLPDRQNDGTYARIFLFDGRKGENMAIAAGIGNGIDAEPGLQLISPSGKMKSLDADPYGFMSNSRHMEGPLAESGTYKIRVWSRTPVPRFFVDLQGPARPFTGTLNEKSPIGKDKISYVPLEVMLDGDVFYAVDVNAQGFEPTVEIYDKESMTRLESTVALTGNKATIKFYAGDPQVRDGKPLLIIVKPAKPTAGPRPKGSFVVNVRIDHYNER